jgi:hypothetical protein
VQAVGNDSLLEQLPVPCEHDASLAYADLGNLSVVEPLVQRHVEAEHAQVPSQPRQVCIGYESRLAKWSWAYLENRRDVHALELRVHADTVAIAHQMGEIHRLSVDEDQLHLRMRDTEGLDGLLDRRTTRAAVVESAFSPLPGQEIVELFVETEFGDRHGTSPRKVEFQESISIDTPICAAMARRTLNSSSPNAPSTLLSA